MKQIIECFNKEEWDQINLLDKVKAKIPSWERAQNDYPHGEIFARDLKAGQWCITSYYKEREEYKIISAQEYLNMINNLLIFN